MCFKREVGRYVIFLKLLKLKSGWNFYKVGTSGTYKLPNSGILKSYLWTVFSRGLPGGSGGKESTCNMGDPRVRSLIENDPLEKEMATHSIILAWKIPWLQEPGGLQSIGLHRVGHDWSNSSTLLKKPWELRAWVVLCIKKKITWYIIILFFKFMFNWRIIAL